MTLPGYPELTARLPDVAKREVTSKESVSSLVTF